MAKPTKGVSKTLPDSSKKPRKAPSSSVKKVTKTPPKKEVIPKKKPPHKIDPTEVLGKTITISDDDTLGRKIKIVENISSHKKSTEPTYTPEGPPSLAEFKTRIHLALIAPLKHNFDQAQFASNVARYVGTAFVVVGGFLTLFNMNAMSHHMTASTDILTAQTISSCEPGTVCGTTGSVPPPSTTPNVNQTPQVDIALESSGTTLSGTLPINVTVPLATRVDLAVYNKSTNQVQTIGVASRVSDLVWRTYWQTGAFQDGEYTLKAIVVNQYGSYSSTKDTVYTVLNHPLEPTPSPTNTDASTPSNTTTTASGASTTTLSDATTTTSGEEETATLPTLRVSLGMDAPLHGKTIITTRVEGAVSVKHAVYQSGTTKVIPLGGATPKVTNEWVFPFNTELLANGTYDIITQAFFADGASNKKILDRIKIEQLKSTTTLPVTQETTDETTAIPTTDATTIEPTIKFTLPSSNPLSGFADAYITVTGASFVEVYAQPEGSLSSRFIGLAVKQSDSNWHIHFNTLLIPNGSYMLFTKVRHAYGYSESQKVPIKVANVTQPVVPEQSLEYINKLKTAIAESEEILKDEPAPSKTNPPVNSDNEETQEVPRIATLQSTYAIEDDIGEEYTDDVDLILQEFMKELNAIMREYAGALRSNDTQKSELLVQKLNTLREDVIKKLPFDEEKTDLLRKINIHIETIVKGARDRTERSEAVLKERIGSDVKKDSDSDSVSDFDEVNLYKTDPFSADSDSDGFIDGVEILNGYDPKDSKREANIAYESPKEQGIVREDLLVVETITTITDEKEDTENVKAHIGGKALPNSFVTLYVFSTPIVVTVKTDAEGNWSYIFDKELDDGEHEVYVGITDNAGKIVAKSNPLTFVKTAEAFAPVDKEQSASVTVTPSEPALVDEKILFVVASIAVVALGLVLILLGLHVRPREKELQLA